MKELTIRALAACVCAAVSLAGCGRLKAAKDHVIGKGDHAVHHDVAQDPPPPTDPIKITGDVEHWANDALGHLSLPAADGTSAKPEDSCSAYYDSMVSYAQAMQAIYVKRYLAWARYQLAVGGFKTILLPPAPMPDYPYGGGYPGAAEGDKSAGAPSTANVGAAPTSAPMDASAGAGAGAGSQASPTAPGAVASEYQTNDQEKGVDETDYVKSNGRYVFVASGNLLRAFDLSGKIVYSAQIAGETPRGLHLHGDRLLLITQGSAPNPYASVNVATPFGAPDYWWGYWSWWRQRLWWYETTTNVHEFKIADDGSLSTVKDRKFYGTFQDGREIDGTVHLVMQKQLPWNVLTTGLELSLHPAYVGIVDEATLLAYAQRMAEENLNAWRSFLFDSSEMMGAFNASYKAGHCQAFSRLTSTTADAIDGQKLLQVYQNWDGYVVYGPGVVDSIYQAYPVFPTYDQATAVATIDLSDAHDDVVGLSVAPVTPSMVYASSDRLVVGNQRYQWINYWRQLYVLPAVAAKPAACIGDAALCAALGSTPATGVVPVAVWPVEAITQTTNFFDFLTFKLSADGAVPDGIGTLPGAPINNYAIDASSDAIRFVVNENQQTQITGGGIYAPMTYSSSTNVSVLRVLKPTGADWKVTAELPLDVGGSVAGVRFVGNAAFVSTSDTSKPLFAVDLANEDAPRLVGAMPAELGSTYFQPMEDGKTLIALGHSGSSLQLALIDVANLSSPSVLARASLAWGGSQAEYDFKSFRFVPRLGLLVLPLSSPFRLDLVAADRSKGFADFGTVALQDKLTAAYGIGGDTRTMLFDDLLVGVFGNQDVGVTLGYAARAPQLSFSKNLQLSGDGTNAINPKWRSATLLAPGLD